LIIGFCDISSLIKHHKKTGFRGNPKKAADVILQFQTNLCNLTNTWHD